MPAVQLTEIKKSYGSRLILGSFSLTVHSGEYLVLLGESGCGKSTTLKIIAGLLAAESGTVQIDNVNVSRSPARNRNVSMVFQGDALYPHLTIQQSLEFPLKGKLDRASLASRVEHAAALMGIQDLLHRTPDQISGGELRRAAVAKSMVRQASVRLLDEPLSALDGAVRYRLLNDLSRLHRETPSTTIHVTHDGNEAMRLADRIAVMDGGKIVQVDTPENIYHHPTSMASARAIGTPPMNFFPAEKRSGMIHFSNPELKRWNFAYEDAHRDGSLTVGIRPEAFCLVSESMPSGSLEVAAVCVWSKHYEGRRYGRFSVGEIEFEAMLEESHLVNAGDLVTLTTKREKLHYFWS